MSSKMDIINPESNPYQGGSQSHQHSARSIYAPDQKQKSTKNTCQGGSQSHQSSAMSIFASNQEKKSTNNKG
ncbi:hypothetical protein TIFTF001_053324 [Ficus carica]|uniref:Uncharacterized protein n=1 Tax=Ficus carica TaxID=3494 RepID=A0AA88EBT8_FICCA|nr:hypothetical protein TIFTF001_053324 [Ficus carica]